MADNAMDDLSKAWAESEEQEETTLEHTEGEDQEVELPETEDEEVEGGGAGEPEADPGTVEGKDKGEPEEPAPAPEPVEKAPASWGAATREHWGKLPKEVQSEVLKRERDFAMGIQRYAESAKRANAMDQALQPFQQYFAMNGNQPGQTIQGLLQTASLLQMGSPAQKAQMVAQLIGQFGVDIGALDNMLAGEEPDPNSQQEYMIEQRINQAVAPYKQMYDQFQNAQQQRAQQTMQQAGSQLQQFASNPKNEFYNDVRGDMADLLDMSASRGQNLTLEDAYQRACMMNPQISQVITSRKQQAAIQNKRRAARSVTGSPGGGGAPNIPGDLRGAIDFAWENSGRT